MYIYLSSKIKESPKIQPSLFFWITFLPNQTGPASVLIALNSKVKHIWILYSSSACPLLSKIKIKTSKAGKLINMPGPGGIVRERYSLKMKAHQCQDQCRWWFSLDVRPWRCWIWISIRIVEIEKVSTESDRWDPSVLLFTGEGRYEFL